VDSDKLFYLGNGIGGSIILPMTVSVGIYFMWTAVGLSFLSGIGVLVLVTILNYYFSKKFFR